MRRLVLAVLACAACGIDATGAAATDTLPAAAYPTAKTHVVVDTDHSGILKAPETVQRVRDLCGGKF